MKKMVLGVMFVLFVLQGQTVFAADYDADFLSELNRNNIRNIERLLERRAGQMNLAWCMAMTIGGPYSSRANGFNKANCMDVLRLLVRYGADVNRQHTFYDNRISVTYEYGYPLENAIEQEHPLLVIQFLLDSGADPNLTSIYLSVPRNPIREAYRKGNKTVVNLLLDRGANGITILPSAGSSGDNETIKQLISRGVPIRSDEGAQALRWAAYDGKIDTVRLLVENGVNVNARASEGNRMIPSGATAASVAYDKGEIEIYNYLKANGAIDYEPRQVTQQPATPAPAQSTTNVYVQPSAPAQPAPAPSAPTLQSGNYAWSNSGTSMTMRFNSTTMTVSAVINNYPAWTGSYRINGSQLVITVTVASGDYTKMRGQTYSYTITSNTSFSGSGETWVRTGI